jgi:hypothetical protein
MVEILVLAFVLVLAFPCNAQSPSASKAGTLAPKKQTWSAFPCEAMLRVEPATVARGGKLKVACELHCTGGTSDVYNPFLWEGYKLPAQIVISSADGKVRHELLRPANRTAKDQQPRKRLGMSGGYAVGREFVVSIGEARGETEGSPRERVVDLPPGEYLVQAIYNYWLVSVGIGPDEPRSLGNWSPVEMSRPMAVSDPVKFTVAEDMQPSPGRANVGDCPLDIQLFPSIIRAKFYHLTETRIGMANRSDKTIEVYNPTLNGFFWPHRALSLAILRGDGTYVGDLLMRSEGSSEWLSRDVWVRIPPGGIVSTRFSFRASQVPRPTAGASDEIPPGRYLLELRAYGNLVSGRPDMSEIESGMRARLSRGLGGDPSKVKLLFDDGDEGDSLDRPSFRDWELNFPGPEICRSNRVELEILPRTGD